MAAAVIAPLAIVAAALGLDALRRSGVLKSPPGVHANKAMSTFQAFYPFYLEQHAALATKRMHYLGTAALLVLMLYSGGLLVLPLAAGVVAGYTTFHFTRHLASGMLEMGVMLACFVVSGLVATGSVIAVLSPMVLAYGCAWIGHFVFERNRPATFIYPTWSLIGDFNMFVDMLRGRVPL